MMNRTNYVRTAARSLTRSSDIPMRHDVPFFSYQGSTSFLGHWAASFVLTLAAVVASPTLIAVRSWYAALMIAVLLGLVHAALPYLVAVASMKQSSVSVLAASFVVNGILLYSFYSLGVGFVFASFTALLFFSAILAVLNVFAAVAFIRSL